MKKMTIAMAAILFCTAAYTQVRMPAASPTEFIRQDFGLGSIELTYSRPGLKGRSIIGVVEPWGMVWRTGANAATKIRFTDQVEIDGKKIDSGTYALYTIPNKNGEWKFIINRGTGNWTVNEYDPDKDVVNMTVKAGMNTQKTETLTMQFSDIRPESLVLNIRWEDFSLRIPITTNIRDRIRASVTEAMKGSRKPYWQAAQFYYEFDKNYKKALEMADAALAEQKNPPYYMVFYKARIQKDMGDKKGALESAGKSLEGAKTGKNANYVIMSEQMIRELQ